jgi:hypothetical protein
MENANLPNPIQEFYMKKYNYTNLDISRWIEIRRTISRIDFSEYLEKRDQANKTFQKITLGAPSNPQNTTFSETYAPYKPLPRIDVKPPRCMLGLDFTKT